MATKGRLKSLELQVNKLYGIREMRACILKNGASNEIVNSYYDADDAFDDKLNELYAATIMHHYVNNKDLHDLYLSMPKEKVKQKLIRRINAKKQSAISLQITNKRLKDLETELQTIKTKPKHKSRAAYIKKVIARLEYWKNN